MHVNGVRLKKGRSRNTGKYSDESKQNWLHKRRRISWGINFLKDRINMHNMSFGRGLIGVEWL